MVAVIEVPGQCKICLHAAKIEFTWIAFAAPACPAHLSAPYVAAESVVLLQLSVSGIASANPASAAEP